MPSSNQPLNVPARLLVTGNTALLAWRVVLMLVVVAVSYLALTPKPLQGIDTGWDKLNHALAFTVLSLSGCLGFSNSRPKTLGVLCAILAYGGMVEVVQSFVPGRTAEWDDFIADAVGVLIGFFVAFPIVAFARNASLTNRA